jgi:hypothetical protein
MVVGLCCHAEPLLSVPWQLCVWLSGIYQVVWMGCWLIVVARISLFGQAATRANATIGHTPSGFEGAAGPDLRRSQRGLP